MRIELEFGANQDIHLSQLPRRIEFVAEFPRCGPDKEIGGHAPEEAHTSLVVMPLDLKAVGIGESASVVTGFAEFENRQMIG